MEPIRIEAKHYLTCLWPGMAELWWRGRLSALPAAIAFAAVINALLIGRYLYADWLSGALVLLACWVVFATWAVLSVRAMRELPLLLTPREVSEEPDEFPQAQLAYLQGQYEEAERMLTGCLRIEPRDPPALLLLSAVYRHTGRLAASEMLLTEVGKLEAAEAWTIEYDAEWARLERDAQAREEDPAEEPAGASAEESTETPDEEDSGSHAVAA